MVSKSFSYHYEIISCHTRQLHFLVSTGIPSDKLHSKRYIQIHNQPMLHYQSLPHQPITRIFMMHLRTVITKGLTPRFTSRIISSITSTLTPSILSTLKSTLIVAFLTALLVSPLLNTVSTNLQAQQLYQPFEPAGPSIQSWEERLPQDLRATPFVLSQEQMQAIFQTRATGEHL